MRYNVLDFLEIINIGRYKAYRREVISDVWRANVEREDGIRYFRSATCADVAIRFLGLEVIVVK